MIVRRASRHVQRASVFSQVIAGVKQGYAAVYAIVRIWLEIPDPGQQDSLEPVNQSEICLC